LYRCMTRRTWIKIARIVNAIFWPYAWLSQALLPVTISGDFWIEKGRQLFRLNPDLSHPVRLFLSVLVPLVFWFGIDRALRRVGIRDTTGRERD
jgi:hypothetical protein